MDSASPMAALPVVTSALATAHLLNARWPVPPACGRHAAIDGLRGYLALSVFLHHAFLWHDYLRTGVWSMPDDATFPAACGRAGVAMFFMVTGFLFSAKLIDGPGRSIDWLRLYVSRATRLTPLYLAAVATMAAMAWGLAPHGASAGVPWRSALAWLAFTVPGQPDLFGLRRTDLLIAGVTWTLQYEWAFYFCLPALALLLRRRVGLAVMGASLLALAGFAAAGWRPMWSMGGFFAVGLVAAVLVRHPGFVRFARTRAASWTVLAALAVTLAGLPVRLHLPLTLLLPAAFCLVAGGNPLFGLLTAPAARFLGEVSYGLYLLHGLLLSAAFGIVAGGVGGAASRFDPATHGSLVVALTPPLVAVAFAAHRLIEQPAMRRTDRLTAWLRQLQRALLPPRLQA